MLLLPTPTSGSLFGGTMLLTWADKSYADLGPTVQVEAGTLPGRDLEWMQWRYLADCLRARLKAACKAIYFRTRYFTKSSLEGRWSEAISAMNSLNMYHVPKLSKRDEYPTAKSRADGMRAVADKLVTAATVMGNDVPTTFAVTLAVLRAGIQHYDANHREVPFAGDGESPVDWFDTWCAENANASTAPAISPAFLGTNPDKQEQRSPT